mgnify:CR=1 FL=1
MEDAGSRREIKGEGRGEEKKKKEKEEEGIVPLAKSFLKGGKRICVVFHTLLRKHSGRTWFSSWLLVKILMRTEPCPLWQVSFRSVPFVPLPPTS